MLQMRTAIAFEKMPGFKSIVYSSSAVSFIHMNRVGGLIKVFWGKWWIFNQGLNEEREPEEESDYGYSVVLAVNGSEPHRSWLQLGTDNLLLIVKS